MSVLKNVLSQWYRYLLWALMSVLFWGWIFGLLTDARPEKKLVLCVDRPEVAEEALSEALERGRPEGIKLVAAHSFDYYIFDTEELRLADLYIVGENEAEKYIESFRPLDETGLPTAGRALWSREGVAYGLLVFDPAEGGGAAASFIRYVSEDEAPQRFYLFFGAESPHREDGKALRLAEALLKLP